VCTVHWHPDERYGHGTRAAYIAACDPDTIRELLDERDQLAADLEAAREDAERWRALREIYGAIDNEADARLIAAAPELLEALQSLFTAAYFGFATSIEFGRAEAAIAKATRGEQ
jgi:hypothetical protein